MVNGAAQIVPLGTTAAQKNRAAKVLPTPSRPLNQTFREKAGPDARTKHAAH